MKNLFKPHAYLLLLSLLLSCSSREKVEITGKANVIKEGVVLIAKGDSIITGENIKENGSFSFIKNIDPGFYDIRLKISGSDHTNSTPVYLEKGKYAVIFDSDPGKYPLISSSSALQKDLNLYYKFSENEMRKATDEYVAAKSAFDKWLATAERTQTGKEVINKVREAEQVLNTKKAAIKEMFISTHPDSKVSAYFLSQLAIETNPKHFLKVYNNLSEKVKRTPYATETKQQIEHILSSYTGSDIPKVFGETPEGKPFDKNLLKNKLTLVVFWASWNKPSTNDFFQLHSLYDELHNKGFEIVGISLDKTKEKWTKSISENKLNWLHVCDFKGAYSANIETFNNNKLPYYILIGPDLKIVDRDVPLSSVKIYFNDFVKKNYTALK